MYIQSTIKSSELICMVQAESAWHIYNSTTSDCQHTQRTHEFFYKKHQKYLFLVRWLTYKYV